jgi:hypothetical protein
MPKITVRGTDQTVTLKVAGALIGPWVDELERCLDLAQASRRDRALRVDLTELTNVSPDGRQLLASIERHGAVFISGKGRTDRFVDELARRALPHAAVERDRDRSPQRGGRLDKL